MPSSLPFYSAFATLVASLVGWAVLQDPLPRLPDGGGVGAARPEASERRVGKGGAGGAGGAGRGEGRLPTPYFRTEVPAHPYDLILGRPTTEAITLSVLAYAQREGFLTYGLEPGRLSRETPRQAFPGGQPVLLRLGGLQPNTRYFYRFHSRVPGATDFEPSAECSFVTARPPGVTFTFTVQADSHLDFGVDPAVYKKSLANAAAARTDFHVDLGDTFMTDKYLKFADAAPQYLAQRYYFGLLGHSAPVFLVLGNHDGEQTAKGGAGPDSMAVWSNGMRKRYFPNPQPDEFYSGNRVPDKYAGLLENYYAWTWGDALCVVLDPYWYSLRERGGGDNWSRTLGRAQYDWLQQTLETSRAKFKFIFIHHLVGGETREGRGGAEASHFYEWGGRELDGRDSFGQHRPGWPAPIHELLVKQGGTIVFHGHDHLYAQQVRDGIIYQMVPQPGHSRYDNIRSAAEYGYKSGVIQGASGILRVTVSAAQAQVEYVRAYPDAAEGGARRTGAVTHRYVVTPR